MVVRFYLFGNYVSHNLGHSFSPVCLLLSEPSPNGEHSVDYSVYCIEIAPTLLVRRLVLSCRRLTSSPQFCRVPTPGRPCMSGSACVSFAAVFQYGAALGLTIHADYLHLLVLEQLVVVCLCKRLHKQILGKVVYRDKYVIFGSRRICFYAET